MKVPKPPQRVGPYRIEDRLGTGGMGNVYRGHDERLDRPVALKHVHPEVADPSRMHARFRREMQVLARLNHPSIIQIYDLVESEVGEWLVMELVEGHSLDTLLEDGPVPPAIAVRLTRDILAALAVAHAAGIVHRDLKSENIMVSSDGQVKVLDFGVAKRIDLDNEPTLTVDGELVGTLSAMSPEQALGETVDHRSDLFAVGILLYELLTGTAPFRGHGLVETLDRIRFHSPPPVHELVPQIPETLSAFVDRLMAKDPAARPTDAAEAIAYLEAIAGRELGGLGQAAHLPFPPPRLPVDGAGASGSNTSNGLESRIVPTPDNPTQSRLTPSQLTPSKLTPSQLTMARLAPSPSTTPSSEDETRATLALGAHKPLTVDPSGTLSGAWDTASGIRPAPGISLKTLLMTDLVDSTELVNTLGDARAHQVLTLHDRLARDLLVRWSGREIDKADGFLLLFERPTDALGFVLDYHRELASLSLELDADVKARAGLHFGEVHIHENTLSDVARGAKPLEVEGIAKPIAARVMALACGGQTLLTQAAYDLVRRDVGRAASLRGVEHGVYTFKGVAEPINLHEVGEDGVAPFIAPPDPSARRRVRTLTVAVALLLALGLGGALPDLLRSWFRNPTVAVLSFHNSTNNPDDEWIATALAEMLASELGVTQTLRTVPGESVSRFQRERGLTEGTALGEESLELARSSLGSDYVVAGSFSTIEGVDAAPELELRLHLQSTDGDLSELIRVGDTQQDLYRLVSVAGTELRRRLGMAPRSADESKAVQATLPNDPAASQAYFEGLEALRGRRFHEARGHLERATALERGFALSHVALSQAWSALGNDSQALKIAERAAKLAVELPPRERDLIFARRDEAANRWQDAAAIYARLWEADDAVIDDGLRLARAQVKAGDGQAALKTVNELHVVFGDEDPRIDFAEWEAQHLLTQTQVAIELAEEAIEKAERLQSQSLKAQALLLKGRSLHQFVRYEDELDTYHQAEEIFRQTGDQLRLADTLNFQANILRRTGRLDEAKALYDEALRLYGQIDSLRGRSSVLNNLGLWHQLRGELHQAQAMFEETILIDAGLQDQAGEAIGHESLGWVLLHLGETARAMAEADEALDLYRKVKDRDGESWALALRSRVAHLRGDPTEARNAAIGSLALSRWMEAPDQQALARAALGRALRALGEAEQAAHELEAAEAQYTEIGEVATSLEIRIESARLALVDGRLREALELVETAVPGLREQGSRDPALIGMAVRVRALVRQGELVGASRELAALEREAESSESPPARLAVALAAIEVHAAGGKASLAQERAREAFATAQRLGMVPWELELRLASGTLALRAGDHDARAQLQDLAIDAEARGFYDLSRRAASLVGGSDDRDGAAE